MPMTPRQQQDVLDVINKYVARANVLVHVAGLPQGIPVSSVKPAGIQQDLWEVDGASGTFWVSPQDIVSVQVK